MSRSVRRISSTQARVSASSATGATVKMRSYLVEKYRASFARRPARVSVTGEDSSPSVETSVNETAWRGVGPPGSAEGRVRPLRQHRYGPWAGVQRNSPLCQTLRKVTLDAFPHHAFDALGAEPVLLQDRIGGSVMAESSNFEIWSVSSFCDRFP